MKNITKVGLSALAGSLAFTAVHAGDVSISGSMIASYTKKGGKTTTGNPLGMNKELTVTGSGELDNGVSVAYKQTITNAMGYNDSELVFTGVPMLGDATIALTSTGSPMDAIDDKTPIAFEEASAAVGSLKDVSGGNGAYGIRYTLADAFGSGVKLDAFYTPGTGDAAAEKGVAGVTGSQEDTYEATLTGAVPMVDGLTFGVGYSHTSHHNDTPNTASSQDSDEGTAYINYSIGGLSVGAQKGVDATSGAASASVFYETEYLGVSYAVSDNVSISYNTIDSYDSNGDLDSVEQDFESISLSYTSGGMTIGVLDADCSNCKYTKGVDESARAIQMTIAF